MRAICTEDLLYMLRASGDGPVSDSIGRLTMTRLIAAWLAVALLATVLTETGWAEQPWTLHHADTMEKVFRDRPFDRQPADKLTIEAARNEVEGVQLVLAAQEELRDVTLDVTELRGESGGAIPASQVSWNARASASGLISSGISRNVALVAMRRACASARNSLPP